MAQINYPEFAKTRGAWFWLNPANIFAARRKYRFDRSVNWRDGFDQSNRAGWDRSVAFSKLHDHKPGNDFRFVILGDTGEGDLSQYGLLPLIRAVKPDFMIINGDVAYPAGDERDFIDGFFKPYRDLNKPIWAVPGNHEYYSKGKGREFYELFCTPKWARTWERYGLRFCRQPGTYWELNGYGENCPLVVIGLDTLQSANLDGYGRGKRSDARQHEWLRWRLQVAELHNRKVIVLFHIPALVRQNVDKKVHLETLHKIIAAHNCVKLVVCGHEHNYQPYSPTTFGKYLQSLCPPGVSPAGKPRYLVSGGGGAFLSGTTFRRGPYLVEGDPYPTARDWMDHSGRARRLLEWARNRIPILLRKRELGVTLARLLESVFADCDAAKYLSFLLVAVTKESATSVRVWPVCMDDVERLFPREAIVDIQNPLSLPDPDEVKACIRDCFTL